MSFLVAGEDRGPLLGPDEEEDDREEFLLVERMTYLTGAEESSGALVHRLSSYSAYGGKRRPTGATMFADQPPPRIPYSVKLVFILSGLTMWSESIMDFILYYLILDQRWDSGVYGTITAIQKFVPVVMNPLWVALGDILGFKAVCIMALLFAADGIALLAFSPWPALFAWGAILAACQAIRPLRTSYVLMATHRDIRTRCTAYLNFSTDSMRMLGALTAKFWDRAMPAFSVRDRHRITTLTSLGICSANLAIMSLMFRSEAAAGHKKGSTARPAVRWTRHVDVPQPGGGLATVDGEWHAWTLYLLTAVYFFLHSMSCAVYFVANMPVLCSVFQLDEDYVQNIKLIQELAAMPAPLLIVWLDRLSDRMLLLIGFGINLLGVLAFSWPGKNSELQPLVGLVLVRASQTFFFTPACSGFSKMMGVRSSGYALALLTSISALGTSVGSWLGAQFVVEWYGQWTFLLAAVPSLLAMAIVTCPWHFRRMAPDDPVTLAVCRQWQADEERCRPRPRSLLLGPDDPLGLPHRDVSPSK